MSEYEMLLAKMNAEREAEIAAMPAPTAEQVEQEIEFLRGWAKSKAIQHFQFTFYKSGKWMTKLTPKMVEALLASGAAVGTIKSFKMVKK